MQHKYKAALVLLVLLVILPTMGIPQPECVAPTLSDQQIKDIIDKERVIRTDLPKPFPEYRWNVRKQGCHYIYIEYGIPEKPEYSYVFLLNQHGVIVDAPVGEEGKTLNCPDKVLTESELAKILKEERVKRKDLPSPLPSYKIRVDRFRCLYYYFEYALPEKRGDYQVITLDPYGEIVDFYRSEPY